MYNGARVGISAPPMSGLTTDCSLAAYQLPKREPPRRQDRPGKHPTCEPLIPLPGIIGVGCTRWQSTWEDSRRLKLPVVSPCSTAGGRTRSIRVRASKSHGGCLLPCMRAHGAAAWCAHCKLPAQQLLTNERRVHFIRKVYVRHVANTEMRPTP